MAVELVGGEMGWSTGLLDATHASFGVECRETQNVGSACSDKRRGERIFLLQGGPALSDHLLGQGIAQRFQQGDEPWSIPPAAARITTISVTPPRADRCR